MTSPQAVSYWLLPAPEAQAVLEQLSALASRSLVACRLPPHITLYSEHLGGDQGVSQEQAIAQLQHLAGCRQPVRLRTNVIEASLLFTKSLVLRFNAEAMTQLHPWFNQLRRRSAAELGYRLDPHLSLLYSQDPFHLRQELAQRLPLPSDPLLFGRVSAVSHPLMISSPADIAACTTLHACSLSCTR